MGNPCDSCGCIRINRKKCNYSFSQFRLTIYGNFTGLPIMHGSILKGLSMQSKYEYFYVSNILSSSLGTDGRLVISIGYLLRWPLASCKVNQIRLSGKVVDHFIRVSGLKTEYVDKEIRITSKLLSEHAAKKIKIQRRSITLETQAVTSLSPADTHPISKNTKISLNFDEPISIKPLLSLLIGIYKFFIFLYNTPSIDFDIECAYKNVDSRFFGELYFKGYQVGDYFFETSILYPGNIMPDWEELIAAFISKKVSEVSLGNLGDAAYDTGRIVTVVAAFEELYRRTHKTYRNKQKEFVHSVIMGYLSKLETDNRFTTKHKAWLKNYRKLISKKEDTLPLQQRIKKAFEEFKIVAETARLSSYSINRLEMDDLNEASSRITSLRNECSHRRVPHIKDQRVILDLKVLEVVMYCMILESLNVDKAIQHRLIEEMFWVNVTSSHS